MPTLPDFIVENFNHGLITRLEKESLPKGAASDSLNWVTLGDHIEVRGGMKLLGTENAGGGEITGLGVGRLFNGTEQMFRTRDRKIEYWDNDSEDWAETGSDALAADADGEEIAMHPYNHFGGAFMYLSSPNSGFYKVPLANPGSVVDQSLTAHKGYFRIKQYRTWLWNRKDSDGLGDANSVYISKLDKDELSDFSETTNENVGTGDGSTKTFTDTLSGVTGAVTCMYVRVTDSVETFTDDRNGNLVGDQGGTGTVNYATGAISVTFASAPAGAQAILADYYTENATSGGILDFGKSTPRTAGEGAVFPQSDAAGNLQNIGTIGGDEYCLHEFKTYKLTLTADDTNATNLIFRDRIGIPNWRAMVETGDGIVIVDDVSQKSAYIRLLRPTREDNANVIPESISDLLDLQNYRFGKAMLFEWGDYYVLLCRHKDSTVNNRMFMYHRIFKVWDVMDYRLSTLAQFNGNLVGGDTSSDNVFELFNGLTDEESNIVNYWISGRSKLNVEGVKKFHRFLIKGLIGINQTLKIFFSYDNGDFVEVGTIDGDGTYVDQGAKQTIGSQTIGSGEIGGGGTGVEASPYEREFTVSTDKFEYLRVKFEAVDVGYCSVSEYQCKDIRYKGRSVSTQYVG